MKSKGKSILFWGGTIFTLFVPVSIGILTKNANASWLAALCGAFVIFIAKLDDIAELSLGPVKAKMRETIREALATLDQLREIAVTSARATLTDSMAGNFMSGTTLKNRLELHDQIIESLISIGVPQKKIDEATVMWNRGVGIIYHRGIHAALEGRKNRNIVNMEASKEVREAAKEFQKLIKFDEWKAPTPDEMENFINEKGLMNEALQELISDYRHFLKFGEIRRRDVFINL